MALMFVYISWDREFKPCVVYCLSDSHSSSLIPSFFFSLFSVSILLGLHDDNNVGDGE